MPVQPTYDRQLLQAAWLGELAAGGEGAVVGLLGERGRCARDRLQPRPALGAMDGGGEEAEEGIELVLGVPRHDGVGDDPAAGGEQPDGRNGGKDQSQAPVSFPHAGVLGITPDDWRSLEHARPLWRAKRGPLAALRRHIPFPKA